MRHAAHVRAVRHVSQARGMTQKIGRDRRRLRAGVRYRNMIRMRAQAALGALIAIFASTVGACKRDDSCKPSPPSVSTTSAPAATEIAFVMGSTNERVGSVWFSSDGTTLFVRFEIQPGYELDDVHVCLGKDPFAWISPGQCPYGTTGLTPGTTAQTIAIPLADLSASCGDRLYIEAHGTVRASGTTTAGSAYAGEFRGQVGYDVSCDSTTTTATTPGHACRLTQGYWKNHPENWPVDDLVLGGVSYTKEELLALLHTPPSDDASLVLVHQLIAARLNVATGSPAPDSVATALARSDAWLVTVQDADGRLPFGVASDNAAYGEGIDLSAVLDDYNNGNL